LTGAGTPRWRNVLFVPGGRTELLGKVARCAPDAVIVDLEDAVAPGDKDSARLQVVEVLAAARPDVPAVLVRVNPSGSQWHAADVAACVRLIEGGTLDGVVLPRYEHVAELAGLCGQLPSGALAVVGLETALGVADARMLLAAGPDACYFGAEDYALDVGGRRTPGGQEVLFARSQVLLAAVLAAVPALDQAVVAVHDAAAFRADALAGRDLGYLGKLCLHPDQVVVAREVFTPSAAQIEHARAVLAAGTAGVAVVDGAMVDGVHVRMAQRVLARAGLPEAQSGAQANMNTVSDCDEQPRATATSEERARNTSEQQEPTSEEPERTTSAVRVGLSVPPGLPFDRIPALARRAEVLGYDLFACGEHVFFHGAVPNGLIALAAAGGATERIRLLSALTLVPTYPAALLAKMIATLDGVTCGRFELGVGIGGEYPSELRACGVDPRDRGPRTDESLEVLAKLFTGDPVSYEGRFVRIEGDRLDPPPVQRPGPPVWVGGRKPAAVRRAARFADVWMPYLMEPRQLAASLAGVREAAADLGRAADSVVGAYFAWTNVDPDDARARRTGLETLSRLYDQDMTPYADRYLVLGCPDRVAERLTEYACAGSATVVIALACPDDGAEAVVELFAETVLPALRGAGHP
jgi:citrate lyase subunit beta/citryl-CoA lyase